jgi:hypothetical protein
VKVNSIGLALLAVLAVAAGCSRDIGDSCSTSVDCDPNGTRACDLSQPGGYCTIVGCSETTCPSGSSCIRLFPVQYLTKSCHHLCEDNPACCPGGVTCSFGTACPPACMDLGATDDCAPDEVCLDVDLCARRALEMRFCAKDCGNNGDCRSGYECRLTGGNDGSMLLSSTPDATTHYCAPVVH